MLAAGDGIQFADKGDKGKVKVEGITTSRKDGGVAAAYTQEVPM
jgi:hypothetical protein